ncbi:MAG: NADH-quinone oxidoreductase subunit J [Pyrinomonadaceae bacterium]
MEYLPALFFILFAGLAVGCAVSVVTQRNPLYSAISLIGVFIALASIYVTLAAPFIAAVQVIVYAGAIMVLVVFVIMLLNVEEDVPRTRVRLRYLVPTALLFAAALVAESVFIIYNVESAPNQPPDPSMSNVGLTASIGAGLFTKYLLPFEITSILLLMAIVGAMTLARRAQALSPTARIIPGRQSLARDVLDPLDQSGLAYETFSTKEAASLLGVQETAQENSEVKDES